MGVPALFRWLSKKYPKIVQSVIEEDEAEMADTDGRMVKVPANMAGPNPNGTEFDSLYLDMNGIVHPCTHPEGKPAPETEEDMMVEIFSYTERVVNMVRPRKVLFMAIDGVAPRAKMNQQRSRRFRSAQEAKDKEEARKEAVAEWEAMGHAISDDSKHKEPWDSNAITPGTPFMTLLASSLRYWVVQKMNTDPGWKDLQVIISDASVPGEGEHKIMDFIRRQRTNPGNDPNTRHVIYGLDADLIMLALATHEPQFKVLREDVFGQDKSNACRICGEEGHYAAQCTGVKAEIKKPPPEKKPFIFLDVTILREYLEVELDVKHAPFPFNFEQAIDDWVLLIFFVGNDFLPHLPSLEIREGAIDTLLKIWKAELPRMGGYLTNHGHLELSRAEIILESLAQREDDIFRRRQEAQQRQDSESKRRRIAKDSPGEIHRFSGPSPSVALSASSAHPSLPQRPTHDFAAKADAIGFGAQPTAQSMQNVPAAALALAGSNRDVVANRAAIRMANMSAAEMLKAELNGLTPVKPSLPVKPAISLPSPIPESSVDTTEDIEVPGLGNLPVMSETVNGTEDDIDVDAEGELDPDAVPAEGEEDEKSVIGVKRKIDETNDEPDVADENIDEEEEDPAAASYAMVVKPDGSVEQEDTVRLWEPGYKQRYYEQKFSVSVSDVEFRKRVAKHYVEGLAWVLHYYYQGTPSWQWYYPFHFAPFASDFEDLKSMDITFELGQPFKPFEQLMGVFPASSRKHIPEAFHDLMLNDDSPIIDFYPTTFQVDMNGKKMLWQGVALLPFIDPIRLLAAMAPGYENLTEDEKRRNRWGSNVLFVSDEHRLYPTFESLYGKRKEKEPLPLPPKLSKGISGSILPNPDCLPGSTYYSPLSTVDLPDISNDRSLSVHYLFPKQLSPHRSMLLPGVRRPPRTLTHQDTDPRQRNSNRGGRGGGRGMDRGGSRGGPRGGPPSYNPQGYDRGGGYGSTDGNFQVTSYTSIYSQTSSRPVPQPQSNFGTYGSNGRPPMPFNNGGYGGPPRGDPQRGGAPTYGSHTYAQAPYQNTAYQNTNSRGGYGGNYNNRGGYNSGSRGGLGGGYGGYGEQNRGGYNGGYNGYNNAPPRGRGRGGW